MNPFARNIGTLTLAGVLLGLGANASANDQKLLDILRQNHVITEQQYQELQAAMQADDEAQLAKAAEAMKIKISGDVRFRHEAIDDDDGTPPRREADRQRIRARIGAYAQVNEELDAGIRIASGSGAGGTSTNQSIGESGSLFTKYAIWLDLAYLDWHPEALGGAHLLAGKMKQPWLSTADMIFDSDLNPDGIAVTYGAANALGQFSTSAGFMVVEDGGITGPDLGERFSDDINLLFVQAAQEFPLLEKSSLQAGVSLYDYDDEVVADLLGGSDNYSTEFKLWEFFATLDIQDTPVPFTLYTQYVNNADADIDEIGGFEGSKGEDSGWLVGVSTKVGKFSLDYNYRDVERNAVVDGLQDSDFALQNTDTKGHKLKLGYKVSKNFELAATYFDAEYKTEAATEATVDTDTLQLDVIGKF